MNATRNEGFSLVELLIAMLVTMVVSGAIFTLLNAGQGAFRRQPELTDRQQNIRLAMDLIQRDLVTAGSGLDAFDQAFTRGDGAGNASLELDAKGPAQGPSGRVSDWLEITGADGTCNDIPLDTAAPAGTVKTAFGIPSCVALAPLAALVASPTDVRWGMKIPGNAGDVDITFAPSQPVKSELPGPPPPATQITPIQIARYAILIDAAGVPNLWRSGRGGLDAAGALTLPGDAAGDWQLVARGIEDMQVRYRPVGGPPLAGTGNDPALPPIANSATGMSTLVREVEVTLWARTFAPNLQGQTQPPGVAAAVRGSLTTVITPRRVLQTLNTLPVGDPLRWQ